MSLGIKETGCTNGTSGLVGGCIGIILVGWSLYSGAEHIVFLTIGQTALGSVTHSEPPGHRSRAYTDYVFHVHGQELHGTATGLELVPATSVRVVYVPSHPDTNQLDRQHWLPSGPIALVVGLAAIAFAAKCFRSAPQMID